jgi:processive 1,2-diacylglycerol beta-glucosyltransferase
MTCTEGMAKGIPMLFYSPIPGQEDANCHYFINRKFADTVQATHTIDKWFAYLANDYTGFVSHYAHLRERSLYYQPDDCAKAIVETLTISKSTIPHQIVL